LRDRPSVVIPRAKCLVISKQYPDYTDLYRYGFLHSRLRAYRADGVMTDLFRFSLDDQHAYREFENIDLLSGDLELLQTCIATGGYDHVLVHLLDNKMWSVLERHLDNLRVTVWVHGAEIQAWQRRAYEFEGMSDEEVARKKKLSDQRAQFWKGILSNPHRNLHLVFVSNYLAQESLGDLGIDPATISYSVINNFVDGNLFSYQPKTLDMRKKILSVRPYTSRTYANDLTVQAILELSRKPYFDDLEFRLVGTGELFDATTAPVAGFRNVTLEKRFLTHYELAALHKEYGVFMTPTRMDTQGVSRDEAMASGLVPVTNRVAAIPEFVDAQSGMLAEAEDASGLAACIERLYHDPDHFVALSKAAAARVRSRSGLEQTVAQEIRLLVADNNNNGRRD
jgi:glycosyltransferase involved in cell wall biosynthesis